MSPKPNKKPAKPSHKDVALAALHVTWKSLRYTPHRLWVLARWTARQWWRLPPWLKGTKVLIILALIISIPAIDGARQWLHYREVYSTYYDHFHASYSKTQKRPQADYYADYYATFYAKYYSSSEYRMSLKYALPSASKETISFPSESPLAAESINVAGLNLIKSFEGLELEPYMDAGGKLTIGYGHLIKPGEFFTDISESAATELLREDVKVAEAYVKRYVKVKLNSNQFAALVSLVYNIGPGNFRKSTLLKLLNKGLGDRASHEFLRWNKVGSKTLDGLTRRRKAERDLFNG